MIKFTVKHTLSGCDYILDKQDTFTKLLPYLKKKLQGEWRIALIDPKIAYIRDLLDRDLVPEYILLEITVDKKTLDTLISERPKLAVTKQSNWEQYKELLSNMTKMLDKKASDMLYKRCNGNITVIKEALEKLEDKVESDIITDKDVRVNVLDDRKVYANKVAFAFLTGNSYRWQIFSKYEEELGTRFAFYALRKYLRNLFEEKRKYLTNKDTRDKSVDKIDAYSIMFFYMQLETCDSPNQLVPILHRVESRFFVQKGGK